MSLPPNLDDKIRKALTLLLAEDDDALRDTLLHFFSSEGFQVYAAGTGREAIDIARNKKISFSIMDIHLAGMNGIDVFQSITREVGQMPCIFMSGDASPEVMEKALHAGAYTFLSKPIQMELMRLSVERLIYKFFREGSI